ncbi:MAG: DUF4430 domain-containing protein [Lachnospiraceae bacterium]|nr:DUF4430 domain-containing protein [Lachnospiraceae bacterium]
MKNFKKIKGSAFIATAMAVLTFMSVTTAYADTDSSTSVDYDITFRVEAPNKNLYYGSLSVPGSDSLTAADALAYLDEKSDELEFIGVDSGYVTQVNGISAGMFGGWDGWYYAVNNTSPDVGMDSYALSSGDSVVLYYGGYPCQIPTADTSKLNSDGIIKFTSLDTEYDADFNSTKVLHSVEGAEVTVSGEKYTTNADGEINITGIKTTGELAVSIEKKDETGAPAVLRFAPDFTVNYAGTSTDTDTESDTDSASDSDNDTETDSDNTSSNTSRVTSASNNATKSTGVVSTASRSAAQTLNATSTGDGRIYMTVGILAVVLVIVILMLLLKKKDK